MVFLGKNFLTFYHLPVFSFSEFELISQNFNDYTNKGFF